jgi:Mg-chelatase subunit ChlD
MRPSPFRRLAALAALAALLGLAVPALADDKKEPAKKPAKKPKVEVVFCLDTTGSMSGLIDAAKQKIWSISNQIASGKPTPDLKIGLVGYRDKGDAYVTKVFDLSDDLDAVHANLKTFQAQGGGDGPEHVNQALHDAVHKIKWGDKKSDLRIVFLVGDAPPHMDYGDDVKFDETCKKACAKGIIINTIQCGSDAECTKFWRDICAKAEGSYVQIEQSGGVVAVATPFDKKLAAINDELARSTVFYGDARKKRGDKEKTEAALELATAAKADRAGFGGKGAGGGVGTYDLIEAIKAREVTLEKLKKEDLPPELRKMSLKEQKEHLDKLDKKRDGLRKEALELDKKRAEHIKKELEKKGKDGKSAFDNQVLEMLRKQAKKARIDY